MPAKSIEIVEYQQRLTNNSTFHMNRRDFITKTGILGTASLFPISNYAMTRKPKFKLGLQLFSIHDDMTKDPMGTLKAVKKMGYQDF